MKHKTWFRLALKLIGVVLIGFGLPEAGQSVVSALFYWNEYQAAITKTQQWWLTIGSSLVYLLQAAMGFYLLFGGAWIVNFCIPSNRPYCPECGYDLSGASGVACPECGTARPPTATKPDR